MSLGSLVLGTRFKTGSQLKWEKQNKVMKNIFNLKTVGFSLLVLVGFRAAATDLYDTYPSYNGGALTVTNGVQLGNQLAFGDTFTITNLSFEYYTPSASFGSVVGIGLDIYANNGATTNGYAEPGTLLYTNFFNNGTGLPAGGPGTNGFNTVNYTASDFGVLLLPSNFTFTVTFSGLTGTNIVEDPLANSPTNQYGNSFGDYWLNSGGSWDLYTNSVPAALVVDIGGTLTPTPEPSSLYIGAVGGALMLLMGLRRRAIKSVKAE